ncbi:endonuclease domain-containing protein [Candidatus Shapirobacteria bacterium]|nr:endonuclease domain-containing protein [Candidatus Shapirobacteria bacterium]
MFKKDVPFEIRTKGGILRYLEILKYASQKNRKMPTNSEKIFWNEILSRDKTGFRFLRQKPIGRFIVDFYCPKLLMIIEVEGGSHIKKHEYDLLRDKYLLMCGLITIRYKNAEVDKNIELVKNNLSVKISARMAELDVSPSLSKRG